MNVHDDDMATPAENRHINKDYETNSSEDEEETIKSEDDVNGSTTSVQSSTRSDRPVKYRSDGKKYVNKNSLSEEELIKEKEQAFKKDKNNMTEEEKREAQRVANRLSSFQCRQRRKKTIERLENRVEELTQESSSLEKQLQDLQEENRNLKGKMSLEEKQCRLSASLHVSAVQNKLIEQKLPPPQTRNQQLIFEERYNDLSSSASAARIPSRTFQETMMLEQQAARLGLRHSPRSGTLPVQQQPNQNYLDADLALNDGRKRAYTNFLLDQQQAAGLTEQAGFGTHDQYRTKNEIAIRNLDIPEEQSRVLISHLISDINKFDYTTMGASNVKQPVALVGPTHTNRYSQLLAEQQLRRQHQQALQEQEERILLLGSFQRRLGKREKYG